MSVNSVEDFSNIFKEKVNGDDLAMLLEIADGLVGGIPGLTFSAPLEGQVQLFKFTPTCSCVECLMVTVQDNSQPSESILKAFLNYVWARRAIMEELAKRGLH